MARWSRSRLRFFGIGAVAFLGGSLLVIPAVSQAEEQAVLARPAQAEASDRIAMVPGAKGRSAFEFKPASGDRHAPFAFVSTGGIVRAQQLGGGAHIVTEAETGAPRRAAKSSVAATTYTTTFTVDASHWPGWFEMINLWNRDTWTYVSVTIPQHSPDATVSLPPGNYYVAVMYGTYGVDDYMLTKAFTVTNKAQTVRMDESSAKEVAITVDDSTARLDTSAVWLSMPNGDLVGFAGGTHTRTYVTTASIAGTTLRVHELLTKAGSSALKPSPYRYDLVKSWPHPLPASPIVAVKTASLAKTTTTIRAQGITTDGSYSTVPRTGEWTGAYLPTSLRFPATITEYVTPGVTMSRLANYGEGQTLFANDRTLPAGTSPGETMGAGPLVPSPQPYDAYSRRYLNQLQISESMTLGDAAGNKGADSSSTTSMSLSSGGQVLKTSTSPSLTVDVPQFQQTYQLDQTTTRKVGWSQLSTKIRSEWTFPSAGPSYTKLPLMDLAMAASGLDERNRASAPQRQARASNDNARPGWSLTSPSLAKVRLSVTPSTRQISANNTVDRIEWSADDGATWTETPLTASGEGVEASLEVPATAAFVSLRVTASNDQGGALRRTVLRALAGPATPGDQVVGGTTISNLKVNGGNALVVGTSGSAEINATFTATDPSGIASAGLYLWHGDYKTPDGLQLARTDCTPVDATTANCTASMYIWDVRYSLPSNALAGAWRAEVWASAKDGVGFIDRHDAGSLSIKQGTTLSVDATPEPVKKGKTITVTGALSRADWQSWSYKPYESQSVALQWAKVNTSTWTTVKTLKTDASGKLATTVTAGSDGSYRFSFAGDAASSPCTSSPDYIDVQ